MQQILLNTESEEHTVQTVGTNRSLQRLLPLLTHGVGTMDGMERGEEVRKREEEKRMSRKRGTGMHRGRWGSWDTHMVSWWISFIGF